MLQFEQLYFIYSKRDSDPIKKPKGKRLLPVLFIYTYKYMCVLKEHFDQNLFERIIKVRSNETAFPKGSQ